LFHPTGGESSSTPDRKEKEKKGTRAELSSIEEKKA